ncbi:MAG: hypothetical protein A2086_08125 [Spirochaetes bacterium GWD1_27_9]|nr:MAG: hypothetical protein A2Z98_16275 [Spirochaetes bacterium GWB1_27_13]OHD24125.1 MAG: hypothetical protein A2Y34_09390 [Spirochaetes bacterium GWC1_27_15]OHD34487.1 MAG: hypothetical protein A2086_08125 [Spirochaetes bacterium GWD1_27_9]
MKKIISLFICLFITFLFYSDDFKIHSLKDGETLWRISRQYNVSLEELCKFNNIKDVTKVKKGAKIKIPTKIKTDKLIDNPKENKTIVENKDQKEKKELLNFDVPLKGSIKPFVTSHFRGLIIFSSGNDNINCVSDGEVNYIDNVSGYGLTAIIKNKDGYIFTYSGFKELFVKQGNKIQKGASIGVAGNLSRYSKPGILFSIQYKGNSLKFDMEKEKFYR